MADTDTERDAFEILASEFMERHRRGERPRIADYVAKYPEHGEKIREIFPTIADLEGLKARRESSSSGRARLGGPQLERLGDFRLIREIGRGGMGIVYEAEQESLGRRVAVKVLPRQALLRERQLTRFKHEAQTAARLHHTNIVPVFGVGHQDEYHYYVMQFIPGVGLDGIIGELRRGTDGDIKDIASTLVSRRELAPAADPGGGTTASLSGAQPPKKAAVPPEASEAPPTEDSSAPSSRTNPEYLRNVAWIGVQVSEALDYAHCQGVLHRDIKPANLLVDAQGVVWIADFGLAKAIERDAVTQTGDILGTLRYMAPEQLEGETDTRSDICSLGLTLYELLCLQPAYPPTDRKRLLHQIAHGEPTRPRKVNPAIPRDLETIVLKAIAREPRHRYAKAEALAADLRNFLEDRPIQARRTSPVGRLYRWARRNRTVASLAGISFVLLMLVAVAATIGYAETKRAMQGELDQRKEVEASNKLAQKVLNNIFDRFVPRRLRSVSGLSLADTDGEDIAITVQPVLSKEEAGLLEHLLEFYDGLGELGAADAALSMRAAAAHRRVGEIHRHFRRFGEARTASTEALTLYREVAREAGQSAELTLEIAGVHNEIGDVLRSAAQSSEAEGSHLKALEVLKSAPAPAAATPPYRFELARTYYSLSLGGRGRNRGRGGGVSRSKGRRDAPPTNVSWEQRSNYMRQAVTLLQELRNEDASSPEYRWLLARCYRHSYSRNRRRNPAKASEALTKATELLEELVRDVPEVPDYRHELSETYAAVNLWRKPDSMDQIRAAHDRLQRALELAQELVRAYPTVPDFTVSTVNILIDFARIHRWLEETDEAEDSLRQALALQEPLVERYPDYTPYSMILAMVQGTLATAYRDQGRGEEARALLESAAETLARRMDPNARFNPIRGFLRSTYANLAEVLSELGEDALATEARMAAEALHFRSPRGWSRGERPTPAVDGKDPS